MGDDLLADLSRQILADLVRSSLLGALPTESASRARQGRLPKSAVLLGGEDLDARLRAIRRWITPKELAALLHWHQETVYRRIKDGLPADRDGDRWKIYPPTVADWLRERREARQLLIRSKFLS